MKPYPEATAPKSKVADWELYFEIGIYSVWRKQIPEMVDGKYIYRIDYAFDGKPDIDNGGYYKLSHALKNKSL